MKNYPGCSRGAGLCCLQQRCWLAVQIVLPLQVLDIVCFCCRAVGITVTVLAGVQWLTSVFWRPDRGVQLRRWWNIWHRSWGRIAFALAIANIYVGLCITQPGTRYFVGQTVVFGVLFALVSDTHTFGPASPHFSCSRMRLVLPCRWC